MTKRLLLAAALLLPVLTRAEIGNGTIEIQGSSAAGFSRDTSKVSGEDSVTTTSFGFNVGGLYYLTRNVGVGAEVQVTRATTDIGAGDVTLTQLAFVPKLGVDFPITQSASVFGEALLGIEHIKGESGGSSGSTSAFVWGIGGGVKLFPMAALSVDLGLRLRSARTNDTPKETDTSLSLMVGLSGYFGTH